MYRDTKQITKAEQMDKINNMDYIVIVNSIDLLTNQAVFKEYPMIGNGMSYPRQTSSDIDVILRVLRLHEINQGRIAIDVTTLIDYNGVVIWDSPGIGGMVDLK